MAISEFTATGMMQPREGRVNPDRKRRITRPRSTGLGSLRLQLMTAEERAEAELTLLCGLTRAGAHAVRLLAQAVVHQGVRTTWTVDQFRELTGLGKTAAYGHRDRLLRGGWAKEVRPYDPGDDTHPPSPALYMLTASFFSQTRFRAADHQDKYTNLGFCTSTKITPTPPREKNPAGGGRKGRPKGKKPAPVVSPEVEALAQEIQALPGQAQVDPRILAATLRRADLTPEQARGVVEDVQTVLPTRRSDADGRRLVLGALSRAAMRADIAAQAAAVRAAEALRQATEATPEGAQTPEDILREAGVARPQATLRHLAPEAAADLGRAIRAILDVRPRGWLSAGAYLSTRLRDSQAVVEALSSRAHAGAEQHRAEEAARQAEAAEAARRAEAERPARMAAWRAAQESLAIDHAAETARRQAAEAHWDALAGRLDGLLEGERDWARLGLAFREVLGARCLDWTELLAVARFVGADEAVIRLSLPREKAWDLGLFQDELPTHLPEAQALSGVRRSLVVELEEALAA